MFLKLEKYYLHPKVPFWPTRPRCLQEPNGFGSALEGEEVEPVPVPVRSKRPGKGKGKKNNKGPGKVKKHHKKSKGHGGSSEPSSSSRPTAGSATRAEVLGSFPEAYQGVIKSLPACLCPTTTKHGQHSYTVFLG